MKYTSVINLFTFIFVLTVFTQSVLLLYIFNVKILINNIVLFGGYILSVSFTISIVAVGTALLKEKRLKRINSKEV